MSPLAQCRWSWPAGKRRICERGETLRFLPLAPGLGVWSGGSRAFEVLYGCSGMLAHWTSCRFWITWAPWKKLLPVHPGGLLRLTDLLLMLAVTGQKHQLRP